MKISERKMCKIVDILYAEIKPLLDKKLKGDVLSYDEILRIPGKIHQRINETK